MKLLLVLILTSLMSGCTPTVDGWELREAQEFCKERGGIDYIQAVNYSIVRCLDGASKQVEGDSN